MKARTVTDAMITLYISASFILIGCALLIGTVIGGNCTNKPAVPVNSQVAQEVFEACINEADASSGYYTNIVHQCQETALKLAEKTDDATP